MAYIRRAFLVSRSRPGGASFDVSDGRRDAGRRSVLRVEGDVDTGAASPRETKSTKHQAHSMQPML